MFEITRRPKLWLCLCCLILLVALGLSAVFLGKSPIRAKFDQIRIGMDERDIYEITQWSPCVVNYTGNRARVQRYYTIEHLQQLMSDDSEGLIYVCIGDDDKVESKRLWEPSAQQRMRHFFKIVRHKIGIGG